MTKDKYPMQADGGGRRKGAPDGINDLTDDASSPGGESQGLGQPSTAVRRAKKKAGGFGGGQSEKAYHGTGQLGEDEVEEGANVNSPTRHD